MKTQIEILHTTAKGAMLITDGNTVAWIKPNMRRADGSFTPGVYAALENGQSKQNYEAEQAEKAETHILLTPVSESEKAICVEAETTYYCHVREDNFTAARKFWVPKSMLVDGRAPKWFVRKKLQELGEEKIYGDYRKFYIK